MTLTPRLLPSRGVLPLLSLLSMILLAQGCDRPAGAGNSESRSIRIPTDEGEGRGGLEVERVGPTEVRLNEPFRFEVRLENEGERPIEGLELRPVSQGIKILSVGVASADRKGQSAPLETVGGSIENASWRVGTLGPREKRVIEVMAAAVSEGELESCVLVSYAPRLCEKIKVVEPELAIETLLDDEWQDRGYVCGFDEFKLIYRVKNVGTGNSPPFVIREELPEGFTTHDGKRSVAIDLREVGPGDTVEKKVSVKTDLAGEFARTVVASGPNLEVRSGARIRVVRPELAVQFEAPPAGQVNEPLAVRAVVQNSSRDVAPGVEAAVDGPDELSVVGARADGKKIHLGDIGPGESREIALVTRFEKAGDHTIRVKLEGTCAPPVKAEVRARITGIPAMRLEVVDLTDPVPVGQTTEYEIRVKNQGSAPDSNVVLLSRLPPELEFVEARGETRAEAVEGSTVRFGTLKELDAGEEVRWRIQARAVKSGQAQFEVELRSAGTPEPVIEREPTTVP